MRASARACCDPYPACWRAAFNRTLPMGPVMGASVSMADPPMLCAEDVLGTPYQDITT